MYFGLYNHINDDGKLIHAKENLGITPHMKIENQEKIIINPTPEAELLTT
jgi:hypothetical protein